MSRRTASVMSTLLLAALVACGGAPEPSPVLPTPSAEGTEPAAEPVAAEAAPENASGAETAAAGQHEAPAAAEPQSYPVAIESAKKGASGPSKKSAVMVALSRTNAIVISIAELTHYCSPAPTFTSVVTGEALELTLGKPTGALSRCVAPYEVKLRIDLPGRNNVRRVVLKSDAGAELAAATVTSEP